MIKLVAFDLDGTLAPSRIILDAEMVGLLSNLLKKIKVAVISGSSIFELEERISNPIYKQDKNLLNNLFLLPLNGSSMYSYLKNGWTVIYENTLSKEDREKITKVVNNSLKNLAPSFLKGNLLYGECLEDRGGQITVSVLGKDAPLAIKQKWDPDQMKRKDLQKIIQDQLPEFDVAIGGLTSIDITKSGTNKAYAVKKIMSYLNLNEKEIYFIGDAVFPGGNDYPVKEMGIETAHVSDPSETAKIIHRILKEND